jgi:hypothetical protein
MPSVPSLSGPSHHQLELRSPSCVPNTSPFQTRPNTTRSMPLVVPVTMSSTIVKGAVAQAQSTSPSSSPAAYALHPVQIKQTPLAQAARHALPALLAGFFAVRFRALVADPVSIMTTTLPLTAALQVAYAVLCLPVAGSQGGGAGARKQKARPGEGVVKKRGGGASGEGAVPSAVVVRLPTSPLSVPRSVSCIMVC